VPDEFLTVPEIAELLTLNPQTIRNWIGRGGLPAVRVGSRRVRIRRSDLDRLLEAGATEKLVKPGAPRAATLTPALILAQR
jgi:excisionase family DNA binding protein